jgi:dolichyl-phosphate-mannose-protein mannosyltransferase
MQFPEVRLRWSRADSFALVALLTAAAVTRFTNLGYPSREIFDEPVMLALARCYLHKLPYREINPPLAGQLIALSLAAFGDQPWSWRLASASLGTALIGISYLTARRMFGSRLAGVLAASLVLCDGMFIVESRAALWEIFYVTFAACSYLLLFRFFQLTNRYSRRRTLGWMGVALGLALGSKLLIPLMTLVLVMAWLIYFLIQEPPPDAVNRPEAIGRQIAGSVLLVGGLSGFVFAAIHLPNFWWGWWGGVSDLVAHYYYVVKGQQALSVAINLHPNAVNPQQALGLSTNPHPYAVNGRQALNLATAIHPYASQWWTWPLLLRPILYWKETDPLIIPDAGVASIRALGNPIIWWAVVIAIPLAAIKAVRRSCSALAFLVSGYALYIAMWIPVGRYKFIYYYLPALYLGILALAGVLDECWWGNAEAWEQAALLLVLLPSLVLGLGIGFGLSAAAAIAVSFSFLLRKGRQHSGRFVCNLYVAAVVVGFIYFLPLWTGIPLTPAGFRARMWLAGWM